MDGLGTTQSAPSRFARHFVTEVSERAGEEPPLGSTVTAAQIASLPAPVQRYLEFMRAVGRPRDWSLSARFSGRFRTAPGPWAACEVLQYDRRAGVSRFFHMKLRLRHLPITVRDVYARGHGRMLARAFDLVPIVDGSGPEIDLGELVTYLNDAILFAPSLLLGPETTWASPEAGAFDVTLTDEGNTVTARVFIDGDGAPSNFVTTDRFFDDPKGRRVRTEWSTPIDGWQEAGDRRIPTRGTAVWNLPDGPFPYADFAFAPEDVRFDVLPDGRPGAARLGRSTLPR